MRLTKDEKTALFELLDTMTDRCPQAGIDKFTTERYNRTFWTIFKKLRLELKGF